VTERNGVLYFGRFVRERLCGKREKESGEQVARQRRLMRGLPVFGTDVSLTSQTMCTRIIGGR